jgi:hypothetical protein
MSYHPAVSSRGSCALAALAVAAAVSLAGIPRGLARLAGHPEPWGADAPAYCRIARMVIIGPTLTLPPPAQIDHDVQQDLANVWGTPYALGARGELRPKHPWLFGLLLVPGMWLAAIPGAVVTSVLLGAALLGFATWRAARTFGALPAALAGLALFFLVPAVRFVCLGINVDVAIALVMLLVIAAAADGKSFLAGLIGGRSLLLRPTMPLLLVPAAIIVLRSAIPHARIRAAIGLLPGALLLLVSNAYLWGSPLSTSYDRAVVLSDAGMRLETHAGHFHGNVLSGLAVLFADLDAGLLFTAPVALAAFAGYLVPAARRPEWWGASLAGAATLLLLTPYEYLTRTPVSNVRFALPLLVTALFPLAALLSRVRRLA